MHPAAVDLIECASALGLRVGLMTNGSLLTPDFAARLVVACDWVRVSIDTKETHGISGEEHAAAWEAVLALAGAKRRQHTTCTVGVSYMVDASTRGGMAAAARQAKHAGADYLEFRPFWGRAAEAAVDLKETWGLAGDGFRVLYARQFTAASREYTTCHGSAFTTVIQADGHVPLCCNLRGKPDWYLGSLHAEPFAQIWTTARRAGVLSRPAPCFPGCRHDALNGMLDLLIGPCEHASFL